MAKIGPKELALKKQREDNLDIPDFLKRTETPEQEAKRLAKLKKRDEPPKGLKVIEPYCPPPEAVRKAIERDLKEPEKRKPPADMFKTSPLAIASSTDKKPASKKPKEKSLSPVLAKAMKDREQLQAKVTSNKSATMENDMSKKAAKKSTTTKKEKSKKSKMKTDTLIQLLSRKNGVTNGDLIKEIGARISASSMRLACEARDMALKIIKKKGEPTRYLAS